MDVESNSTPLFLTYLSSLLQLIHLFLHSPFPRTSHYYHIHHLFWLQLCGVVPVAESAVVPKPPGVQIPVRDDGSTVRASTSYVSHSLRLQGFNQLGGVTVSATKTYNGITLCFDFKASIILGVSVSVIKT